MLKNIIIFLIFTLFTSSACLASDSRCRYSSQSSLSWVSGYCAEFTQIVDRLAHRFASLEQQIRSSQNEIDRLARQNRRNPCALIQLYNQILSPMTELDHITSDITNQTQHLQRQIGDLQNTAANLEELQRNTNQAQQQIRNTILEFQNLLQLFQSQEADIQRIRAQYSTAILAELRAYRDQLSMETRCGPDIYLALRQVEQLNLQAANNAVSTACWLEQRRALAVSDSPERTVIPRNELHRLLAQTTLLIARDMRSSFGSGFYTQTINSLTGSIQYQTISAMHVITYRHNPTSSSIFAYPANLISATLEYESNLIRGSDPTLARTVDADHSLVYDAVRDAVAIAAPPGPALSIVGENYMPRIGERSVLAGHPGEQNEMRFSLRDCTFVGVTDTDVNFVRSWRYIYDCPENRTNQAGMSGGPAVNESGEVVGIVVAHAIDGNGLDFQRLLVSPIHQNSSGQIRMGIMPQIAYPNCYNNGNRRERPTTCTVR